jgi:pimeloyl-ACP methyl ester carboxylesterase
MNVKYYVILILAAVLFPGCTASYNVGFERNMLVKPNGDSLKYFIGHRENAEPSEKLLIMIQGSGRESIARRFGWGIEAAGLGYDILYLEKFAFEDSLLFFQTDTRERRYDDITSVMKYVENVIYKGRLKEIMIIADSEGGVIAPEITANNKKVNKLLVLSNGGLSGTEKTHIILEKEKKNNYNGYLTSSGISTDELLDSLLRDIKQNPTTDKSFLGNSYKYWNSYIYYDIDSQYEKITVPTLIIIGENDYSIPVESVTILREKLKGKKNFSFHIVPDANHFLIDSKGNRLFPEIMKNIIYPWFKSTVK